MLIKCGKCGLPRTRVCDHCGDVAFGTLRLRSPNTGKACTFDADDKKRVGRNFLRTLAGDEAVYASEPQFMLYKDRSAGGWVIARAEDCVNPTYLDGRLLEETPALLTDGVVISVKDRMPLEVHLDGLEQYG